MRNGKELRTGGNIVISEDGNVYRLELNRVAVDDHGIYQFEVRRKDQGAVSVASLIVLGLFSSSSIAFVMIK